MKNNINKIYDEYHVSLEIYIKKRVSNEQDSEDILQDVFMKIYKNIDSISDINMLQGWIFKIAGNTIIDYYRKNSKIKEFIELSENMQNSFIEEKYANGEIAYCLKNMIEKLPYIYKQAIIMTQFQNITTKELSEKLGISVSGAKSRVQRGKKMLRNMLTDCCYLELDCKGNIIDYKCKINSNKYC